MLSYAQKVRICKGRANKNIEKVAQTLVAETLGFNLFCFQNCTLQHILGGQKVTIPTIVHMFKEPSAYWTL